jgi:hypothetical protein
VIVRRWQAYTGKAATFEGIDLTFEDFEGARASSPASRAAKPLPPADPSEEVTAMTKKPREPRDPRDTTHPRYEPTEDPTHPFYGASKMEGEPKPGSSDKDAYKVGPGYPPNEHKWKKGCPSPFPTGRPKKVPSMKPEIKKIFEDALNEQIPVTKAEKKIKLTKIALGLQQLATRCAKGDRNALRDVFTFAGILGVDLQGKEVVAEALGIDDQAILDDYVRRRQQSSPGPDDHVKAPPDLVDDDVAKPEPNETAAPSPESDTPAKKPVEPVLDEHGKPLPVSDIRYIRALRERNLAQQKKNREES